MLTKPNDGRYGSRFITAAFPDAVSSEDAAADSKVQIKEQIIDSKILAIAFATLFNSGLFLVDRTFL